MYWKSSHYHFGDGLGKTLQLCVTHVRIGFGHLILSPSQLLLMVHNKKQFLKHVPPRAVVGHVLLIFNPSIDFVLNVAHDKIFGDP